MASPPQHNREQALDFMKTNPEYTFLTQNLDSKKYYAWKSRDDIVDDGHLTEYMLEHEPRRFYIDWEDYYPLETYDDYDCGELLTDAKSFLSEFATMQSGLIEICEKLTALGNTNCKMAITANIRDYEWRGEMLQKISAHCTFHGAYFKDYDDMLRSTAGTRECAWRDRPRTKQTSCQP
mgnify:CR=1 FL=1